MAKLLNCGEVVPGCQEVVRADTEEEVVRQASAHAASDHGMTSIDHATMARLKAAIRDV